MPKIEKEIVIRNPQGLHARPAAMFVQIVSKYNVDVIVKKDGQSVNGKSIMGILTLEAKENTAITIIVDGDDAQKVVDELEELLTNMVF